MARLGAGDRPGSTLCLPLTALQDPPSQERSRFNFNRLFSISSLARFRGLPLSRIFASCTRIDPLVAGARLALSRLEFQVDAECVFVNHPSEWVEPAPSGGRWSKTVIYGKRIFRGFTIHPKSGADHREPTAPDGEDSLSQSSGGTAVELMPVQKLMKLLSRAVSANTATVEELLGIRSLAFFAPKLP